MSSDGLPIAFAADALGTPTAGIGRYAACLLGAMAGLHPRPPLRLFHSGRHRLGAFEANWPTRWIRLPDRVFAGLAVWGPLPVELFIGAVRLVHSPDCMSVRSRAPLILTVHDLIVFKMPRLFPDVYTPDYNPGYEFYRAGARLAIPRAAHIICISESTRADLLETFDISPERVTVIPYGAPAPPAGFRPDPMSTERPRVLFMGRVEHRKNLPTAVEAVRLLRQDGVAAELIVCGDDTGPESSEIKAHCQPGTEGWLTFRGAIGQDEVWSEYQRAGALIYPSWYEGFGLPPFEAFGAGVPVVASNTSSLQELLEGAAELCNPGSPRAFADALGRVLTDPAHRQGLIAAGHTRAAGFTWEHTAAETLKVYERFR